LKGKIKKEKMQKKKERKCENAKKVFPPDFFLFANSRASFSG
jgi:hypothetical protein